MVEPQHRASARLAGLQLVTITGPGMEEGLNDLAHHAILLPAIRATIAEAAREHIAHVIVFSGRRGGRTRVAGIEACVQALHTLSVDASAAGVGILLEVLNEHDHPDQQCSSMDFAAAVVQAVDAPSVRILYDLYHGARMGENVLACALAHLPLIGHLHVAQSPRRDRPIRGGNPDYHDLVRALMQAGYQGWWGHEYLPADYPLAELQATRHLLESAGQGASQNHRIDGRIPGSG